MSEEITLRDVEAAIKILAVFFRRSMKLSDWLGGWGCSVGLGGWTCPGLRR